MLIYLIYLDIYILYITRFLGPGHWGCQACTFGLPALWAPPWPGALGLPDCYVWGPGHMLSPGTSFSRNHSFQNARGPGEPGALVPGAHFEMNGCVEPITRSDLFISMNIIRIIISMNIIRIHTKICNISIY